MNDTEGAVKWLVATGYMEQFVSQIAKEIAERLKGHSEAVELPPEANELAAMMRDAARYRHVRKDPSMLLHLSNKDFDTAIDAAMRQSDK